MALIVGIGVRSFGWGWGGYPVATAPYGLDVVKAGRLAGHCETVIDVSELARRGPFGLGMQMSASLARPLSRHLWQKAFANQLRRLGHYGRLPLIHYVFTSLLEFPTG